MGRLVLLLVLGLTAPSTAAAYTFATDKEDGTGEPLSWLDEGPIEFRLHYQGGGGLPGWLIHGAARNAFATWAEVAEADIEFEEGPAYSGVPCPHAIPEQYADLIPEACGSSSPPDYDYQSALYFMEAAWPFGEAVIALTTLSWAEGARLVDADISFNGLDYVWTIDDDDDDVVVDYESIATHEIGHFLGLGHSEVEGAIMRVDYEEASIRRELGQDDIEGVAALYPCESEPCIGSVGHVEGSACDSAAGGGRGLLALLLVVCVVGLSRRRWTRAEGVAAASLLVLVTLAPASVTSSTVLALSVHDLAARSDRVARVRVASVEAYPDRLVRSRIELDVLEDLAGSGPDRISLDQPGGVLPDRGTIVFGMPRFQPGQEVVVFVDGGAVLGPRVVGLAQGAFAVQPDGELSRDTSGLMLARVGDGPPTPVVAPAHLDELRAMLP